MKKNTKRWLTLGISSLLLLTGISFMPSNHVSANQINRNQRPVTTLARKPKRRAYHQIGHYTNQHKYFVGFGISKNYREFSYLTNHQVNNLYHYRDANHFVYDGDFTIFHNTNVVNQIPRVHLTRYLNLGGQKLYHAYGNNRKFRNVWVLNHMLSNHRRTAYSHRYKGSPLLKYKKHFTNVQENRYAKHYLTKNQYKKYRYIKQTYNNLVKYHNYSGKNRGRCNRDLGKWINFYRMMHHLPRVSYNPGLASSTKDELSNDTYPNVLGLSDVPSLVEDGITDSNNTNYGITPDRNAILNPADSEFGGYIFPNGNGNFSSGIDFNKNNNLNKSVVYPSAGLAALGDAYYGKYWSYTLPANYYGDIDTPKVSVYDCTDHKRVKVSHVHVMNNEIYYKVNMKGLNLFHTYRIHFSGGNIPNNKLTYKTTLIDIGELDGFDGYYDQFL